MSALLGIVGFSGRGKTTLAEALTAAFTRDGLRVGFLKHTHHPMPQTGEGDTSRLLSAGAEQAWLVGAGWSCRYSANGSVGAPVTSIARILEILETDIIIIEGFKKLASWNCLAVVRDATELEQIDAPLSAVICAEEIGPGLPRFDPSDTDSIAKFALTIAS